MKFKIIEVFLTLQIYYEKNWVKNIVFSGTMKVHFEDISFYKCKIWVHFFDKQKLAIVMALPWETNAKTTFFFHQKINILFMDAFVWPNYNQNQNTKICQKWRKKFVFWIVWLVHFFDVFLHCVYKAENNEKINEKKMHFKKKQNHKLISTLFQHCWQCRNLLNCSIFVHFIFWKYFIYTGQKRTMYICNHVHWSVHF